MTQLTVAICGPRPRGGPVDDKSYCICPSQTEPCTPNCALCAAELPNATETSIGRDPQVEVRDRLERVERTLLRIEGMVNSATSIIVTSFSKGHGLHFSHSDCACPTCKACDKEQSNGS